MKNGKRDNITRPIPIKQAMPTKILAWLLIFSFIITNAGYGWEKDMLRGVRFAETRRGETLQLWSNNSIGKHCRIDPTDFTLRGATLENGTQVLRVPKGSTLENVILRGGGSHNSVFADIRGSVIKFAADRSEIPLTIEGIKVPSSHTLMDRATLDITRERNQGKKFPFREIHGQSEALFLVHSSYCHPNELLLPQGSFIATTFQQRVTQFKGHKTFEDGILYLEEERASTVTPPDTCKLVVVKLKEGGFIVKTRDIVSRGGDAVETDPGESGWGGEEVQGADSVTASGLAADRDIYPDISNTSFDAAVGNADQLRILGREVKRQRRVKGLSQRELAARAGLLLNVVHRLESGKSVSPEKRKSILRQLSIASNNPSGSRLGATPPPGAAKERIDVAIDKAKRRALGRRLKRQRRAKRFTQKELAAKAGLLVNVVRRLENEEPVNSEETEKILEQLGLTRDISQRQRKRRPRKPSAARVSPSRTSPSVLDGLPSTRRLDVEENREQEDLPQAA